MPGAQAPERRGRGVRITEKAFGVYRNVVRGIAAAVLIALIVAGARRIGERGGVIWIVQRFLPEINFRLKESAADAEDGRAPGEESRETGAEAEKDTVTKTYGTERETAAAEEENALPEIDMRL